LTEFGLFGKMRFMIMSQQEFTDAVARVPALWGRKIVTILEVADGMARIRVPMRGGFWVPVEKLERVGRVPIKGAPQDWPRKRSEVC
jgi:hypothetical protein